jgi:hypothetical protein
MKNITLLALVLIVAGVAAEIAKTRAIDLEITASACEINAAFRDGAFQGKLAAERGDIPHLSVARWSTNADRALFASGYEEAYVNTLSQNASSLAGSASGAAFRDGLYLGKLDSEIGAPHHLAVGRWSNDEDRVSFAEGYNQSYEDAFSANAEQRRVMRQASLIH